MRLRVPTVSLLVAIALAALAMPAAADDAATPTGPGVDPSIGSVEVTLELPKDKPYVGEMIMLRMRSFVRADVVLDQIKQPPLLNFSWQQLGRDKPIQAMINGFSVAGVERDLAIFPDSPGRLIIEPFRREVTIATSDNRRVEATFSSKPVYVDVQNYTAICPPDVWWLPSKSVTLTDTWSQVPDEIKPGTLARRTITIEALGLTGDRLPPPPKMQAAGTIAFRGPVNRETIITDDGPIAKGTYVWDLRPVSPSPAELPVVSVSWFDTQSRRMRESALPATWVALVGTLVHPSHEIVRTVGLLSPGPLAAGAAGFAWAAGLIAFAASPRGRPLSRRARRGARALRQMRASARARDPAGFSRAINDLALSDAGRWAQVSASPSVAAGLAALDQARFGRHGGAEPELPALAAAVSRSWRRTDASAPDQTARA